MFWCLCWLFIPLKSLPYSFTSSIFNLNIISNAKGKQNRAEISCYAHVILLLLQSDIFCNSSLIWHIYFDETECFSRRRLNKGQRLLGRRENTFLSQSGDATMVSYHEPMQARQWIVVKVEYHHMQAWTEKTFFCANERKLSRHLQWPSERIISPGMWTHFHLSHADAFFFCSTGSSC